MIPRSLLLLAGSFVLAASALSQPEAWKLDPAHSSAQFAVRHLGISTVRGGFTKVNGTVQYDPAEPANAVIAISIDADSVDTRNERRDKDLRSAEFLDVAKYPNISFKSKKVESPGKDSLTVTGDLTIHGVTKEAVLNVDGLSGPIKDMQGKPRMGATAETTIDRRDFGITAYPGAVGNELKISIDVELVH